MRVLSKAACAVDYSLAASVEAQLYSGEYLRPIEKGTYWGAGGLEQWVPRSNIASEAGGLWAHDGQDQYVRRICPARGAA